jgi:hypothetical protein
MAKAKPNEKPNEGSLARTAKLARKLLAVPKHEVDRMKQREQRAKEKRRDARQ